MIDERLKELHKQTFIRYCFDKLVDAVEYDRFPDIAYYTYLIEKEQGIEKRRR